MIVAVMSKTLIFSHFVSLQARLVPLLLGSALTSLPLPGLPAMGLLAPRANIGGGVADSRAWFEFWIAPNDGAGGAAAGAPKPYPLEPCGVGAGALKPVEVAPNANDGPATLLVGGAEEPKLKFEEALGVFAGWLGAPKEKPLDPVFSPGELKGVGVIGPVPKLNGAGVGLGAEIPVAEPNGLWAGAKVGVVAPPAGAPKLNAGAWVTGVAVEGAAPKEKVGGAEDFSAA